MIFTKPAHRKIAAPVGGAGKPTAAFQPNTGYAEFPSASACYFTDLISGQTPYIEDSVPGQADVYSKDVTWGTFVEGVEGFETNVNTGDGVAPQVSHLTTESIAWVFEFTMTRSDPSFTYLAGFTNAVTYCVGPRNVNCSEDGIYWDNSLRCLGSIGSGALHRLGIKSHRTSGGNSLTIVLDGAILYDAVSGDFYANGGVLRLGLNKHGQEQRLFCSGCWLWAEPFDGSDPLSNSALIELTTDPWPHLAVLD